MPTLGTSTMTIQGFRAERLLVQQRFGRHAFVQHTEQRRQLVVVR